MKQEKLFWWDRYFSPWSKEHNDFYEKHKSQIFEMMKDMDWNRGIRKVTYKGKGFIKTFEEKF